MPLGFYTALSAYRYRTLAGKLCVHTVPMLKREVQQLTEMEEIGASVLSAGSEFHCHQTHNPQPTI